MTPSALHHTALQTALSELLRVHAPQATLLASLGEDVLRVRADSTSDVIGHDLVPPDDWFNKGEMTWLTRDGALLGLLWSEDGQVSPGAVQVLTMLLAAAREDGANREAEVLVTQLPMATAWITGELMFRKVSRPFLEMFSLSDMQVVGQAVEQVFPGRPALLTAIQAAVAGRSVRVPDELFGTRWVRGEARPYFGGTTAGVMMTLQDVTGEYDRSARVAALLDTDRPAALLSEAGAVIQASQGLLELIPPGSAVTLGAPLWAWPCFADAPSRAVSDLVHLAASGGAARADVELAGGGTLPLSVRRTSEAGLLVAEGLTVARDGQAPLGMISEVLALSEDATILVDHAGRAQLVSERAAQLLGVDAARLVGLGVSRVLGELGVKAYTPNGDPLTLPDWREVELPYKQEVLLATPDGLVRHMELRATGVGESGTSRAGLLLIMRDLTALRRAQAKMRHAARHDSLTGLMNRVGLREMLVSTPPSTTSTTPNPPNPISTVVSLDIDGFGALNAALGRTACDRILIQVAAWLNDLVTERGGHAARLADDAFAVTLPNLGAQEAAELVQEVVTQPLKAGGRDLTLSVTLGAATTQDSTLETALSDSEIAAQHAKVHGQKGQGGTQISIFNASMRDSVTSAFELADALRAAVPGKQLTLLYQPAIDLQSGQPVSAEALLRWNHPTLGVLSPNAFLDVASRSDLIMQISEWVVQAALQGRRAVRAALPGYANWRVSVNLGLEELRRSAGLSHLLPLLQTEGSPDIEVAAGSLLDHSEETLGLLEQLRALGAHLSVDDFGEGASSLSALTRFPLHHVKLHPTLTAKLPSDPKSVALVQGTIDLAHRLGLSVTAVGVETEEQLKVLRELGCDAAQGFAIAPPMHAPDLLEWLNKS